MYESVSNVDGYKELSEKFTNDKLSEEGFIQVVKDFPIKRLNM